MDWIFIVALFGLIIAGLWKMFEKGGQPGWACIVPILNLYCLVKLAGRPGWMLLLVFIPILNLVLAIILASDISTKFGKGGFFALGVLLFPFVFYPILGFGSARYQSAPSTAATSAVFD